MSKVETQAIAETVLVWKESCINTQEILGRNDPVVNCS